MAFATSKPACRCRPPSSTTWAFANRSSTRPWPMPTKPAIDAHTPTSPRCSFRRLERSMPKTASASISRTSSMPWTRRPSICVCRCSRWRCFDPPKPRSRCTRSWICVDRFTALSTTPTAKLHDVNILDLLAPEAGAFHVMDRGYLDFERLSILHQARAFFMTRARPTSTRGDYTRHR